MKICVPMTGRNKEELLKEASAIRAAGCDLAEWRADCFDEEQLRKEGLPELLGTLKGELGETQLLFTFRTREEGGSLPVTEEGYFSLNLEAARSGQADIIDLELFRLGEGLPTLLQAVRKAGAKVLLSNHDFEKTPALAEMERRFQRMKALGGDILKIAVMPQREEDVEALLNAARSMRSAYGSSVQLIAIAMGDLGKRTRVSQESDITFGTIGRASAPGQMDIEELRKYICG